MHITCFCIHVRKTNEDGFLSLQLVGVACTCLCMYLYIHNLFSCKYTYIQVACTWVHLCTVWGLSKNNVWRMCLHVCMYAMRIFTDFDGYMIINTTKYVCVHSKMHSRIHPSFDHVPNSSRCTASVCMHTRAYTRMHTWAYTCKRVCTRANKQTWPHPHSFK